MDWNDLRYALALSRAKTQIAAAKSLGVTHTTVARRIEALERDLGARLFNKTPQGFVPTQAGEDILAVGLRVEEEMLGLDRQVLGLDARLSGKLRVTTFDIFAVQQAKTFTDFSRRYPDVTLETRLDNTDLSLSKREADVAIRVTSQPPAHLFGKRLGRMGVALYGAKELVASGDVADPQSYPWLAYNVPHIDQWMKRNFPKAHIVARLDSAQVSLQFLCAGMGIAYALCLWADACPELVRLSDPVPDFETDLWLLTHPDLKHTARVRALMEHMNQSMSPLQTRMLGKPHKRPSPKSARKT